MSSPSNLELNNLNNRTSVYDNHKPDEFLFPYERSFISEKSVNINNKKPIEPKSLGTKHERDEFDDLIDLTHRAPRKLFKKELSSNRKNSAKTSSSLPPLPPLPYSFVKLEKSKITTTSSVCLSENTKEKNINKNSTTRLIIPVNRPQVDALKENANPYPDKPSDVVKEWDQISKIFASLEHLLNEVVETTSKNLAESERNNIKPRQDVTYRTMSYTDKIARKEKLNVNQNLSYRTLCAKDLEKYALKRSENEANYSKNMKYLKHIEVGEFLKKINMAKYEFKFLTNGYDDLCFMNNVITLQDLLQIGIEDYNDIFFILNQFKQLPSYIKRINNENLEFKSVEKWLCFLNLKEYSDNFSINDINSMEKVKHLWELELTTILQIPFVGHRRRIMAAIQECLKLENETHVSSDNEQEYIDEDHLVPCLSKQANKNYSSCKSTNSSQSSYSGLPSSSSILTHSKSVKFNEDSSKECQSVASSLSSGNKTIDLSKSNLSSRSNSENGRHPKPIWRNDPQNLIKGTSNFTVYYLGSSAITKDKSNHDPVKYTIDRLKNTSKSTPYPSPKVELAVSINGVKLLNHKSKEFLCNYDIKHINNVCQDQDDLNYFAFSTQTDPSAHYYCHVFSCKDKDLSTQVILTIGQAFDIAYELFCKNNFN